MGSLTRHGVFFITAAALVFAGLPSAGAGTPVGMGLLERIEAARSHGEIDRGKAEFYKLAALFAPERIPARLREPPPAENAPESLFRCGTLILRSARESLPLMDAATRAEAEDLLALPVVEPSEPEAARTLGKTAVHVGSYWAETENFTIEWDAALTNEDGSTPLRDENVDGVPDVVELWAKYFEQSFAVVVGDMGYTDLRFSFYKVTVFINSNLRPGLYGLTWEPDANHPMPVIEVNRNLSFVPPNGDADRIRGAMKVTAAHEFFHVIHFLYLSTNIAWESREDDWWLENSSTWMEDEVFDHVNDYYQFYLSSGWASLLDEGLPVNRDDPTYRTRAYGGAVFPKYLQQHAGGLGSLRYIWTLIQSNQRILDGPHCTARDPIGNCTAWNTTRFDGALTDFAQGFDPGWGEEDIHLGYSAANVVHDYDEGLQFGDPALSFPIPASGQTGPKFLGSQYRWDAGGGSEGWFAVTLSPDDPAASWGLALAVDRGGTGDGSYPVVIAGRSITGPVSEKVHRNGTDDAVYAALDRYAVTASPNSYAVAEVPSDPPAGTPLAAVTDLLAAQVVGGLRLTWTLPDPSSVEGVIVRFRKVGDTFWQSRTLYGPWTEVEIGGLVDPGATAQSHEVQVFVYDPYGNEGERSALTNVTPGDAYLPDPPAAIIVSTGAARRGGGGGGGCFLETLGF